MGFGYGSGNGTSHNNDAMDNETGKRVRKTFGNSMLAHVWAQNSQTFGQSGNGNFYFHGPTLYSYGSHFVVGIVMADGFAFLNSQSYSISTSQHQGEARASVRGSHTYIADLTKISGVLANSQEPRDKATRARCFDRLKDHFSTEEGASDMGAMVLAFTYCGASLSKARAMADICARKVLRVAAKRRAMVADAAQRRALDTAKQFASRAPEFYTAWALKVLGQYGGGDWGRDKVAEEGRNAFRAAKAAKARGWAGIATKCRAAHKSLRAVLADAERVEMLANRREKIRTAIRIIREFENTLSKDLSPCVFLGEYGPADAVKAWKCLSEQFAIVSGAAYTSNKISARARIAAKDAGAQAHHWAIEAHEEKMREQAEARAEWLAGTLDRPSYNMGRLVDAEGGALLRAKNVERNDSGIITDGTLQTSWGADVPLVQAIRAFRFLKLCRERGNGWNPSTGGQIKVGHFKIDWIDARGNFAAACHRINWAECGRIAGQLGLDYLTGAENALSPGKGAA